MGRSRFIDFVFGSHLGDNVKQVALTLLLLATVVTCTLTVPAQSPDEKPRLFLSTLKEGQPVSIKEISGRYEISILEGVPVVQGHKVLEIGSDFLVVNDVSGITETHIPIWSIKAIIRVRLPKK